MSGTLCLTGCAIQPEPTKPQIPSMLASKEMPIWETWYNSYLDWLKNATQDGTDAQNGKMP
jgi:hypothetical protein